MPIDAPDPFADRIDRVRLSPCNLSLVMPISAARVLTGPARSPIGGRSRPARVGSTLQQSTAFQAAESARWNKGMDLGRITAD